MHTYYALLVSLLSSSHHHLSNHNINIHQQDTHTHHTHSNAHHKMSTDTPAAEGDNNTPKVVEEIVRGAGAYEDPELLHKLADTLRQKMKIRNGVLQETRVDYFKGMWCV